MVESDEGGVVDAGEGDGIGAGEVSIEVEFMIEDEVFASDRIGAAVVDVDEGARIGDSAEVAG